MSWKRTEPRDARPFFLVSHLDDVLEDAFLIVGEQQYEAGQTTIPLEPEILWETDILICPELDTSQLATVFEGFEDQLILTLSVRDPMLKRKEALEKVFPLKESIEPFSVSSETVKEFSHGREVRFSLALTLSSDIDGQDGLPDKAGQWVAKKAFALAVPQRITNFNIHQMLPDQAKEWLGSEGALVYVEYQEGTLGAEAEEGLPVAECFVAKSLLDRLGGRNSQIANAIVSVEIIYRILLDATDEILELDEVSEKSPLYSVLSQLGAPRDMSLAQLKKKLSEPYKLRALLEDRFNLINAIGG